MTLVELLVVVSIMMIIMAVTLPRLRPELERGRTREAARSLHLYLTSARNRAVLEGRPCGVIIERMPTQGDAAMIVSQVEAPPPYCCDTLPQMTAPYPGLAQVQVQSGGPVNGIAFFLVTISDLANNTAINIWPGDQIQFNYQGPWYNFIDPANTGKPLATQPFTVTLDVSQGTTAPWPPTTASPAYLPFKIMRRPIKAPAAPLQFPVPAVIDLTFSGVDTTATPTANGINMWGSGTTPTLQKPIIITFAPAGVVERLYFESNYFPVTQPIFLFVGKLDKVDQPSGSTNLDDISNLWVAINPLTGLVSTTSMAAYGASNLSASRANARQSATVGGGH
jgi:type II secretory pathway pseudopilin PulG